MFAPQGHGRIERVFDEVGNLAPRPHEVDHIHAMGNIQRDVCLLAHTMKAPSLPKLSKCIRTNSPTAGADEVQRTG